MPKSAGDASVWSEEATSISGATGRGIGSMDLDTGFSPDKLLSLPILGDFFNARLNHVGYGVSVRNIFEMLSSSLTRFVRSKDDTAKGMLNLEGDLGTMGYIMEDEFNIGVIMPKQLITPRKNVFDPLQCGVFQFVTKEDTDDSDRLNQTDPLAWWSKTGFNPDVIDENTGAIVNAWGGSAVVRNIVKDTSIFVGSAFGFNPFGIFKKREAHPFHWTLSTGATPAGQDGIPWPVPLYTSRRPSITRFSKYTMDVVGVYYDEDTRTVMVMQADNALDIWTDPIILNKYPYLTGLKTGMYAPSYSTLTAWMDWLPHLVWDPNYPVESGLHSYLTSAMALTRTLIPDGKEDTFDKLFKGAFLTHKPKTVPKTPQFCAIINLRFDEKHDNGKQTPYQKGKEKNNGSSSSGGRGSSRERHDNQRAGDRNKSGGSKSRGIEKQQSSAESSEPAGTSFREERTGPGVSGGNVSKQRQILPGVIPTNSHDGPKPPEQGVSV